MKKLFKTRLAGILFGLGMLGMVAPATVAQVKGISYTLSPTGEYVFWDKNTGISNGFLVGGHLGFGFGEFVELRATYLQDVNNLKRDFSALSPMALQNAQLDTVGVSVQRWGGDLKLNLSRGGLVPYVTVGTGVQTIGADTMAKFKNIYVSAGAGLQFSGGDRYTLNVQAVNTAFNGSPVRSLTTAAERTANNLSTDDYPNELLKNWSVRASLILYLGGRRPGELTDVDKAYLNNFSGGLSLPIEVTAGQLNFGKSLPYANTRYAGVSTGLNFGPYVGIRGFYWRGLEDGYFSQFSKLALYGGEGKFKLGTGQGLTPSILLGGGVIDAMDGYQADSVTTGPLDKKGFVSGGLGLDFPFGRAVKLTAYAKALLTAPDSIINAVDPNKLTTSWAYGLSLNLLIGNGMKTVESRKEESYDELVMNNLRREKNRAKNLKDDYQMRIERLDDLIKDARRDGDRQLQYDLQDEQDRLEEGVRAIEDLQDKEESANREATRKDDAFLIDLKPTEYRDELDKIEQRYGRSANNSRNYFNDRDNRRGGDDRGTYDRNSNDRDIEALEDRLRSIEQKLDDMMQNNQRSRQYPADYNNRNNERNGNDNNGDYRNGNNTRNRNYRNDDRQNQDYRNGDNRNRSGRYDDRDYRNNRNDNQYDQNGNYQNDDNGSFDNGRRNMNGSAGGSRNGAYQADTNDKMMALKEERQKSENLRQAYEARIDELETQLEEAKEKGDEKLESDLNEEKEALETGVSDIRDAQDREDRANRRANRDNDPSQLRMESDEFRSMIDDVNQKNEKYQQEIDRSMQKFEKKSQRELNSIRDERDSYRKDMEQEMDNLKKEIRELRAGRSAGNTSGGIIDSDNDARRNHPSNRSDRNTRRSAASDNDRNDSEVDVEENRSSNRAASMMTSNNYLTEEQLTYESKNKAEDGFFSLLNYDGSSAVGGINFGGAATLNLGFRNHFRYKTTNFYLMPEAFFGFGASSSYGLFANGIYDFEIRNAESFSPYAGAGLGLMKIGDEKLNNTKVAFNIVLGANLFQVAGGRFYVDYSIRNFFKYNQLSAGYRLPF
ncbi:hypothetical protein [Persicitalea jodogahamensis]|uniref:Outer membrane protein beta-barrel domain-containing protein n=1 Tax=Persicitalea jodogahamensis TaxID=402147 RepID=A0A8J3D4M8_9BACT|nr:hypothetical protein [Persicitalea jodogahamensis]GHB72541.1 hypothetical protein GCM10007390_28260 [Persicitalea jodogahamensis]